MTLLALLGGLALLLYGMQLSGEGLQRAAGGHLRHLLTSMTRNRVAAVGAGALVTALIQSSSATTLMLIGFVSAGLITFRQSLGVILGRRHRHHPHRAAPRLQSPGARAPSCSAVGFALTFFARRGLVKSIGQAVLGFGFLFLGMRRDDGRRSRRSPSTRSRARCWWRFASNPGLGALVGARAERGHGLLRGHHRPLLSLAHQGLLPLDGAIPVVLGANVGTCATALAASMRSTSDARRVAVAHIAFKVLGVALVFPFIRPAHGVRRQTAGDTARQIANAHTLFNVAISALFLPFAPLAARVITALVPERRAGRQSVQDALPRRPLPRPARARPRAGHPRGPAHGRRRPEHAARRHDRAAAPTTRSCWRTSSGATTSSTTSSARSSSSSRASAGRP